jgi:hypothetical protein
MNGETVARGAPPHRGRCSLAPEIRDEEQLYERQRVIDIVNGDS